MNETTVWNFAGPTNRCQLTGKTLVLLERHQANPGRSAKIACPVTPLMIPAESASRPEVQASPQASLRHHSSNNTTADRSNCLATPMPCTSVISRSTKSSRKPNHSDRGPDVSCGSGDLPLPATWRLAVFLLSSGYWIKEFEFLDNTGSDSSPNCRAEFRDAGRTHG